MKILLVVLAAAVSAGEFITPSIQQSVASITEAARKLTSDGFAWPRTATVPEPDYYGFSFPTWWHDSYESADAGISLGRLAATGANSVAIIPTWVMQSSTSAHLERTNYTASDASVRKIIAAAHGLGLKVVLKPHIDPMQAARAWIRPTDTEAWFEDYRRMILDYARMARDEKVAMFVVGTELTTMTEARYSPQWRRIIQETREIYPGPVTYAANWYDYDKIDFWPLLDYISIDAYFSMDRLTMRESWQQHVPALREASLKAGKKILFTEVGIPSMKGAKKNPWDYTIKAPVDLIVQRDYFHAFLDVLETEPFFAGFLQWNWDLNPNAGGPKSGEMTVQGKPALDVLRERFRAWRSQQPAVSWPRALLKPLDWRLSR